MRILCVISLFFFSFFRTYGQESSPASFGKISIDDFKQKVYPIDSAAHAVVVAEIGSSALVGNNKGWFSLEYKVFRRIHILSKAAFDLADVSIPLYRDDTGKEKVQGLRATTYNLENGTVTTAKLNVRDDVFEDKISSNRVNQKFTMPNVKEGSIIEYEYKMVSDFLFNFQPWAFQGSYPCLWSEYNVSIPYFYDYMIIRHGYQPFDIEEKRQHNVNFTVRENGNSGPTQSSNFSSPVSEKRWVIKNTPAVKEESYVSSISNLISRVEFQLSQTRSPLAEKRILGTWQTTSTYLLDHDNFGAELSKSRSWFEEAMKKAVGNAASDSDKAKNIFQWVRDNFKCTRHNGVFTTQSLKETLRKQSGNVAEINLLLICLLREADLKADPVLLSTRSNGYTYELYPIVSYFNYVIVALQLDETTRYLDASIPYLGFSKLHFNSYNGHARVINKTTPPVYFYSDSLIDGTFTKVSLAKDTGGKLKGTVETTPGYFESLSIRELYANDREIGLQKKFMTQLGEEYSLENLKIADLEIYEKPLKISYDLQYEYGQPDIIYFNPLLNNTYRSNPFKSADRRYPVEMPYRANETYLFTMDVPDGYEVEELPGSLRVKLNELGEGFFEYRSSAQNGKIQVMYRLSMRRANFDQSEYELLRTFYSQIVKKHSEQIVFKKIAK